MKPKLPMTPNVPEKRTQKTVLVRHPTLLKRSTPQKISIRSPPRLCNGKNRRLRRKWCGSERFSQPDSTATLLSDSPSPFPCTCALLGWLMLSIFNFGLKSQASIINKSERGSEDGEVKTPDAPSFSRGKPSRQQYTH